MTRIMRFYIDQARNKQFIRPRPWPGILHFRSWSLGKRRFPEVKRPLQIEMIARRAASIPKPTPPICKLSDRRTARSPEEAST